MRRLGASPILWGSCSISKASQRPFFCDLNWARLMTCSFQSWRCEFLFTLAWMDSVGLIFSESRPVKSEKSNPSIGASNLAAIDVWLIFAVFSAGWGFFSTSKDASSWRNILHQVLHRIDYPFFRFVWSGALADLSYNHTLCNRSTRCTWVHLTSRQRKNIYEDMLW